MTTVLILVALINLGLLCALMVRYQPQTGLPPKQQQTGFGGLQGYQPPVMVNPYAAAYAQPEPPVYAAPVQDAPAPPVIPPPQMTPAPAPMPAAAPPSPDLTPLYEEAARQLDLRLDRMEKLLVKAEQARMALEAGVQQSQAMEKAVAPGLPTRHAKVRFLNNEAVQSILNLADQGKSPMVIARELGRGVDEVLLTLNLRQMAG